MGKSAIFYTESVHRAVVLAVLLPLYAQDTAQHSKASEYPAHVSLPGMEIAAEYLLHSIPTAKGFYVSRDYLVIDVGVFPIDKERITISSGQFRLRINHQTQEL